MSVRVGILGRGRLGRLVADAARAADDLEAAWAIGRDVDLGSLDPVDVAVDVSHPDAVAAHLDWAEATGTDLVVGTTGWPQSLVAGSPPAGHGVLLAPNFSLSVALLRRLTLVLGRYAAAGPAAADLAVHETHHRHKADTPSGTAVLLAEALAQGAGRPVGEVQVTSHRLGAAVGRHEVHLETDHETLTLGHVAHTRDVFAQGALTAVRWLHGRAGLHTLDDLAADLLVTVTDPAALLGGAGRHKRAS